MVAVLNPFRLLSEIVVLLLGALLIMLATSGRVGLPTQPAPWVFEPESSPSLA